MRYIIQFVKYQAKLRV